MTIILVIKNHAYTFYLCSPMSMQSQIIVQIQNLSFNLAYYLKYVLLKCSQCEKLEKCISSCNLLLFHSIFNFSFNSN